MADDRILLVALSNIGDAVMTTPVVQALHAKYPQTKIDIVADQRSSEIFRYCPQRGDLFHKDKRKPLRGALALIKTLRERCYRLAVDLRTDGLAYLLRADRRLTRWGAKAYGPHAVERHMGIIRPLHGSEPIPVCCVWISEEEEKFSRNILGEVYGKRLLGLGPGANWPGKIWPAENYQALIHATRDNFDAVVLLGDRKDQTLSAGIAGISVLPCIDLCGKTSLLQAVAVMRALKLFVGNDSGLGHLASAAGIPTLTIFGPGQPERYRPWGDKANWLVGEEQKIVNVTAEAVVKQLSMR